MPGKRKREKESYWSLKNSGLLASRHQFCRVSERCNAVSLGHISEQCLNLKLAVKHFAESQHSSHLWAGMPGVLWFKFHRCDRTVFRCLTAGGTKKNTEYVNKESRKWWKTLGTLWDYWNSLLSLLSWDWNILDMKFGSMADVTSSCCCFFK